MHIDRLTIHNLRNIASAQLEPGPALNILFGDNGAGKTTVLESVLLLAKGRSFRSGATASLIGPDLPCYRVMARFHTDDERAHRLGLERSPGDWKLRLDGADLTSINDSAALLPLMLMEPTSHLLVGGGPDQRRKYLDWSVFHVKHEFLNIWRRYGRVIRQRNAALRQGQSSLVASLDPQLVDLGVQIDALRQDVTERLFPLIKEMLALMSPQLGKLSLEYRPGWKGDDLQTALNESSARDAERGMTLAGPHRADLGLKIEGKAVRDRFSRGEQKVLAAALLLAQASLFAVDGHVPVVLLDDLASEFDEDHLQRVVQSALSLGAQLFVTGTSAKPYTFVPTETCSVFHVKQGVIKAN